MKGETPNSPEAQRSPRGLRGSAPHVGPPTGPAPPVRRPAGPRSLRPSPRSLLPSWQRRVTNFCHMTVTPNGAGRAELAATKGRRCSEPSASAPGAAAAPQNAAHPLPEALQQEAWADFPGQRRPRRLCLQVTGSSRAPNFCSEFLAPSAARRTWGWQTLPCPIGSSSATCPALPSAGGSILRGSPGAAAAGPLRQARGGSPPGPPRRGRCGASARLPPLRGRGSQRRAVPRPPPAGASPSPACVRPRSPRPPPRMLRAGRGRPAGRSPGSSLRNGEKT